MRLGFVPIWNYIVLKLLSTIFSGTHSFVPIWNYIVLKLLRTVLGGTHVLYPYGITLF